MNYGSSKLSVPSMGSPAIAVGNWGGAPHQGLYATVLLVSTALLMLEVSLTRLFSFTIWYHFALPDDQHGNAFDEPAVLAIGVGGGIDLINAIKQGARHVTGAELQPETILTIGSIRHQSLQKRGYRTWSQPSIEPFPNPEASEGQEQSGPYIDLDGSRDRDRAFQKRFCRRYPRGSSHRRPRNAPVATSAARAPELMAQAPRGTCTSAIGISAAASLPHSSPRR
jgi:hypothetical protein